MSQVDAYAENLQTSRRDNSSLDTAMLEVDEWNKRFSHTTSTNTPPTQ